MDIIARYIDSHLQFDLIEIYLCFDWCNNCGESFHRELVKSVLTILEKNILPTKLQTNKNARVEMRSNKSFIDSY